MDDDQEAPPARSTCVFVGNLPLPRDMPGPEEFEIWFDSELQALENGAASGGPGGCGDNSVGSGDPGTEGSRVELKEEEESRPVVAGNKFVLGVEGWSARDGVCFVRLKDVEFLSLGMRMNGRECRTTHLAVCPPQCLPDPLFAQLPVVGTRLPRLQSLPYWKNNGYLIFSNAQPSMEEKELRSLFEALGGPLETLYLFKSEELDRLLGASLGCGRCSYSNSLIIESVIQRLRSATLTVAVLVDSRRAEVLASLEKSNAGCVHTSLSEQLMGDPLTAFMLRSGRLVGAKVTRIVQLYNFITLEDILCDTLRSELVTAVKLEAEKYGRLESLVCPLPDSRLGQLGPDSAGANAKIFLEYTDTTAARRAQLELNGRTFNGKVVCAAFYPLLPFQLKRYYLFSP